MQCIMQCNIYIYIKRYSVTSVRKVSSFVTTHTHRLTFVCVCVCVSSHRLTFVCVCVCVSSHILTFVCVCVCCHTMLVWQIGERDSVSEATRYVSEANRYVGEARKPPQGLEFGPIGP